MDAAAAAKARSRAAPLRLPARLTGAACHSRQGLSPRVSDFNRDPPDAESWSCGAVACASVHTAPPPPGAECPVPLSAAHACCLFARNSCSALLAKIPAHSRSSSAFSNARPRRHCPSGACKEEPEAARPCALKNRSVEPSLARLQEQRSWRTFSAASSSRARGACRAVVGCQLWLQREVATPDLERQRPIKMMRPSAAGKNWLALVNVWRCRLAPPPKRWPHGLSSRRMGSLLSCSVSLPAQHPPWHASPLPSFSDAELSGTRSSAFYLRRGLPFSS
jgi:hypothetical protein